MDEEYVEGEYDVPGLVVAGGLTETFDPSGFFDGEVNAATAKRFVGKLKSLEELLKASEQYGKYAKDFALLEAQTFIKISECVDAESKLTPAKKRLVVWLRNKTSDEIDEILKEVSSGVRITYIEKRDNVSYSDRDARVNSEMKRIQNNVISNLESDGCTQLSRSTFYEQWSINGKPDKATVDAFTESTRDIILKKGGRGLGDDSGTYMFPHICDRDNTRKMVQNRINVILNNIKSLAGICKERDFFVSEDNLQILHNAIDELGDDGE